MTRTAPLSEGGFKPLRPERSHVRHGEVADAALAALGDVGFARSSMRAVARSTGLPEEVLHDHFHDTIELTSYCVRRYKARCVTRYDEIVSGATSHDDLASLFAESLVQTMEADAAMHRLWYDIRSQAMFEERLRPTVVDLDRQLGTMICRVVDQYAVLRGQPIRVSPTLAYAVFDGLFESMLRRLIAGDVSAGSALRAEVLALLPVLVAG